MDHSVLAVIFDFDDTLVPDSTTKLLREHGVDVGKFWETAKERVKHGYDPGLAYLNQILDFIGKDKPLGELTNSRLNDFGRGLDKEFFPGVPELLSDLRDTVSKFRDISIEFYIISGGLKPVIDGSAVVREHLFEGVYASEFDDGDSKDGVLRCIKRTVSFTEKTRYIFEINKGIHPANGHVNPDLVNKSIPVEERRIPIQNMIYVGDGYTDIPCFSLVGKGTHADKGGSAFGVFDPEKPEKAKDAFREFIKGGRVVSLHSPRYRETDDLGALIRTAVFTRCSEIDLSRNKA